MKRSSPLRRKTRIKPVSAKRQAQNVLYREALAQWRAGHDGRCEMRFGLAYDRRHLMFEVCVIFPGDPMGYEPLQRLPYSSPELNRCRHSAMAAPHHRKGRSGSFLYDISTWSALCIHCHDWVHSHANLARALGWLEF